MAKKSPKNPAKSTAAKKRSKKPARIPALPITFRQRWLELAAVKPPAALPARLISSIVTLRPGQVAPGPVANPDIFVFARKVQGTGCEKQAEIAGWYSKNLAPNGQCIGQAAVKAILDAVARQECCNTLKCPDRCPCRYIPQAQLAAYTCTPGVVEEGYLLQGTEVWNCDCLGV